MAPVPATLDVSFVSNFVGQHRVCWRIPPALVYDCTTVVTCLGNGATCSVQIPIVVENESCDTVTYEGYVQASCEDINSISGRIPFSITFTPVPVCESYSVTCENVPLLQVDITNPGSGYDPLNPPLVTPFGGGGAGAAVTVTIGNSIVTLNPGSGYVDGVYPGVPLVNVIGSGTGAFATITVAGGVVTAYTITTSGQVYLPGDTFTVNTADIGGGAGSGFVAGFQANYGTITVATLVTPGDGFTSAPALTLPNPVGGGVLGVLDAILDVCPDQDLGPSCDSSAGDTLTGMSINQSIIGCMTSLPIPLLSNYTFTPAACCYDCNQVSFAVDLLSPAGTLVYTDCTTHELVSVPFLPGDSIGPICMVANSWFYEPESIIVVGVGATC